MSSQYPEDEFDYLPEDSPVGVHRKPRSAWHAVLPFLVALVVVPLLAWAATALIRSRVSDEELIVAPPSQSEVIDEQSGEQSAPPPADLEPDDTPTAAPEDPLDPGGEDTGTDNPPSTDTPVAEIQYGFEIAVLNASGIEGHAGRTAGTLNEAGFTNTWTGNAENSATQVNTVFYPNAELRPTAEKIGQLLGIENLVEDSVASGENSIAVLLRS